MSTASELGRLYEAVFGEPPSALTNRSLLAMEQLCGLQQDDPLARVMIINMRVIDLTAASLAQRSTEEAAHLRRLEQLTGSIGQLLRRVEDTMRRSFRRKLTEHSDEDHRRIYELDVYRKTSPLLSHLMNAFHSKNCGPAEEERISLARTDLFFTFLAVLTFVMFGAVLEKFL